MDSEEEQAGAEAFQTVAHVNEAANNRLCIVNGSYKCKWRQFKEWVDDRYIRTNNDKMLYPMEKNISLD